MRLFLVGLISVLGSQALAGRPFLTEDAGVLARGDCEWESVAAQSRAPDAPRARSLSTQIGCGLGGSWQLAANVGWAKAGDERVRSLGLGGKWGAWSAGDSALTVAWSSSWSRARGARQDWDGAAAALVYSQGLRDGWTAHANLIHSYSRAERRGRTGWAALIEHTLLPTLDLGAEVTGEGSDRPGLGLGARWRPVEAWTLDASWSRSGGDARERLITVGLKREF